VEWINKKNTNTLLGTGAHLSSFTLKTAGSLLLPLPTHLGGTLFEWMLFGLKICMGENEKKIQKKRGKRKEITVSDGRQTMDGWKAVIGTAWHSPVALMKWEETPWNHPLQFSSCWIKISSNGFYLLLQRHPPFGWGIGCIVVGVSEAKSAFIGVPVGWLNREWNGFGGLDNFGLPL
jgi:hypothetical protein